MADEEGGGKGPGVGGGNVTPDASATAAQGKPARVTLSRAVQKFIVEQNACDEKPSDVVKAVKEEFGVDISRQLVERYDPTKAAGSKLSEKLSEHYWEVREKYERQEDERGIGSISYRLRRLAVIERIAFAKGSYNIVMECLKQAAEDKGGKYTNRREMGGPGGGPIPLTLVDQIKAAMTRAVVKLIKKGKTYAEARDELVKLGVDEADIPDEHELSDVRRS